MPNFKDEKKEKLLQIKNMIHDFRREKLNDEMEGYRFKLCDSLGRRKKINIMASASEQWAASIIYVIARLNFLFDRQNEYHITPDDICDKFHTKKSTTGNKATQIERLCNLSMGAQGYCSEKISDMFAYYTTESGFIIPKVMIDNRIVKIVFDDDDEADINKLHGNEDSIQIKREQEEQRHLTDLKNKAEKPNKDKNQLKLFDN